LESEVYGSDGVGVDEDHAGVVVFKGSGEGDCRVVDGEPEGGGGNLGAVD
jgi:hypothetical protein